MSSQTHPAGESRVTQRPGIDALVRVGVKIELLALHSVNDPMKAKHLKFVTSDRKGSWLAL